MNFNSLQFLNEKLILKPISTSNINPLDSFEGIIDILINGEKVQTNPCIFNITITKDGFLINEFLIDVKQPDNLDFIKADQFVIAVDNMTINITRKSSLSINSYMYYPTAKKAKTEKALDRTSFQIKSFDRRPHIHKKQVVKSRNFYDEGYIIDNTIQPNEVNLSNSEINKLKTEITKLQKLIDRSNINSYESQIDSLVKSIMEISKSSKKLKYEKDSNRLQRKCGNIYINIDNNLLDKNSLPENLKQSISYQSEIERLKIKYMQISNQIAAYKKTISDKEHEIHKIAQTEYKVVSFIDSVIDEFKKQQSKEITKIANEAENKKEMISQINILFQKKYGKEFKARDEKALASKYIRLLYSNI